VRILLMVKSFCVELIPFCKKLDNIFYNITRDAKQAIVLKLWFKL
jgi:hypothetical protein